MDSSNPAATTVEQYMGGTASWRTDLYATTCGTLMTHGEFVKYVDNLGLKFAPELKTPSIDMPFDGDYTQEKYAQQLIDDYKAAGISPRRVFPQSFLLDDVVYWLKAEPEYARQAVYLDARVDTPEGYEQAVRDMPEIAKKGVPILAPAMFGLISLDENNRIVPSEYAVAAKKAGIKTIAWSLERSGPLTKVAANNEYYYSSVLPAIKDDGDLYEVVHVLAQDVGVLGIFSDW
jgi:glycerophosphoryl diester phosphodiesterase